MEKVLINIFLLLILLFPLLLDHFTISFTILLVDLHSFFLPCYFFLVCEMELMLLGISAVCYHHKCKKGIIIFLKHALTFTDAVNS